MIISSKIRPIAEILEISDKLLMEIFNHIFRYYFNSDNAWVDLEKVLLEMRRNRVGYIGNKFDMQRAIYELNEINHNSKTYVYGKEYQMIVDVLCTLKLAE